MEPMTAIRINAITVPAEGADELARRFAQRAGAVDHAEGFEGSEARKFLRPVGIRDWDPGSEDGVFRQGQAWRPEIDWDRNADGGTGGFQRYRSD